MSGGTPPVSPLSRTLGSPLGGGGTGGGGGLGLGLGSRPRSRGSSAHGDSRSQSEFDDIMGRVIEEEVHDVDEMEEELGGASRAGGAPSDHRERDRERETNRGTNLGPQKGAGEREESGAPRAPPGPRPAGARSTRSRPVNEDSDPWSAAGRGPAMAPSASVAASSSPWGASEGSAGAGGRSSGKPTGDRNASGTGTGTGAGSSRRKSLSSRPAELTNLTRGDLAERWGVPGGASGSPAAARVRASPKGEALAPAPEKGYSDTVSKDKGEYSDTGSPLPRYRDPFAGDVGAVSSPSARGAEGTGTPKERRAGGGLLASGSRRLREGLGGLGMGGGGSSRKGGGLARYQSADISKLLD